MNNSNTTFTHDDIKALEPEMKVGLLATIDPSGLPHLTLITTLRPNGPKQVIWGQFSEGMSKANVLNNSKTGFLMMTLDKNIWRGKAVFTHTAITGQEFDLFNSQPLFRYNSYFGIHRVYYMDLIEQNGKEPLPMSKIVLSAIKTVMARKISDPYIVRAVINPWGRRLVNKMDNLKFLTYVGDDGFPLIIPVIQAQVSGSNQIIFSSGVYSREIDLIPTGRNVAFFCMSLNMEDVLMRGIYRGIQRRGGFECGIVDVDWIYSPMPPKPEQIFPEVKLEPVIDFF